MVKKCLNLNVESPWIIFMSSLQNYFVIKCDHFTCQEHLHTLLSWTITQILYKDFATTYLSVYITISPPYLYLWFCPQRYRRAPIKSSLTHIDTIFLDYQFTIISIRFIMERFFSWVNWCWIPIVSSSSCRFPLTIHLSRDPQCCLG